MAMATPTPGHKVSDSTQRTRALVIIKVYDFKKQGQRMDTFEHRIGCILFKYSARFNGFLKISVISLLSCEVDTYVLS